MLACHFNTTAWLDCRTSPKIPIDYMINKYKIDVLLIIANHWVWNGKDYVFTFEGDK